MARLSKRQASLHAKACAYLEKDALNIEERLFVLQHWQESAHHINAVAGAFFTPQSLAGELSIEVHGRRIIDLCAGIGALAFAYYRRDPFRRPDDLDIVCVEINPDYVAAGRKVLLDPKWIVASVFNLPANIGTFDCAIANPPFGHNKQDGQTPRYRGCDFEYAVIDAASQVARHGFFHLPQGSCPFRYSGVLNFQATRPDKYVRFHEQTGIELEPNCGIDTMVSQSEWHHSIAVTTEIAVADFTEGRAIFSRVVARDRYCGASARLSSRCEPMFRCE